MLDRDMGKDAKDRLTQESLEQKEGAGHAKQQAHEPEGLAVGQHGDRADGDRDLEQRDAPGEDDMPAQVFLGLGLLLLGQRLDFLLLRLVGSQFLPVLLRYLASLRGQQLELAAEDRGLDALGLVVGPLVGALQLPWLMSFPFSRGY